MGGAGDSGIGLGGGGTGAGGTAAGGTGGVSVSPLTGPGVVRIVRSGTSFQLLRDDAPYRIRGIGGQDRLALAAASGANSTRTWGSGNAGQVLDDAAKLGMTVTVGVWLSHNANDFNDPVYKDAVRGELERLLDQYRNHPALLFWALGNELNLGAATPAAFQFVQELAARVHERDPNHPTMTVLADAPRDVIGLVTAHAPAIDVLGVNSYGGLPWLRGKIDEASFTGPFVVTEWGPNGHWEVPSTSWARPIEQTSEQKRLMYQERYRTIESWSDRCFGSYAFLWGQKQERTPTWYGLFAERRPELGLDGEATPAVEALAVGWSGFEPANHGPTVTSLTLNGRSAGDSLRLTPGASVPAIVAASDADGDALNIVWELLREPTELGSGGSDEPRPATVPGAVSGNGASVTLTAPGPGEYRLFVYVKDGKGSVGTANFPFRVQ